MRPLPCFGPFNPPLLGAKRCDHGLPTTMILLYYFRRCHRLGTQEVPGDSPPRGRQGRLFAASLAAYQGFRRARRSFFRASPASRTHARRAPPQTRPAALPVCAHPPRARMVAALRPRFRTALCRALLCAPRCRACSGLATPNPSVFLTRRCQ